MLTASEKTASRKLAKELGAPHYYTGEHCRRGHDDNRYAASADCVSCVRERAYIKRGGLPTRPEPDCCELCLRLTDHFSGRLCFDHDAVGFRGWLCNDCNTGLGKLGDDAAGLIRALAYVLRDPDVVTRLRGLSDEN